MKTLARRLAYVTLAGVVLLAGCDARGKEHAFTSRILHDAHAELAFVDASTASGPAIMHRQSGMLCRMTTDGAAQVEVFPQNASNPGAECMVSSDSMVVTMIAVRFADRPALDAAFHDSVNANARLEGAAVWRGPESDADRHPAPGSPHFRVMRLQGQFQGNDAYMRIAMTEANGWYVQQIVLTPIGNADAVETTSGAAWRDLLGSVAHTSGAPAHA